MRLRYLPLLLLLFTGVSGSALNAQSSRQGLIATGDQAHRERRPSDGLRAYEAVLRIDSLDYEALWKASRDACDLSEFERAGPVRNELSQRCEQYARRALAANTNDAEGHFALARALGRTALSAPMRERTRYAEDIRNHAVAALAMDPSHAGALHVLGRWNAEMMRVSGPVRFLARRLLGARIFEAASWPEAVRLLSAAVAVEPDRLVHRLVLAEVYIDLGERDRARELLRRVVDGSAIDYNDPHYQRLATALLARL